MPELPEVEAVCNRLRREAIGARIVRADIFRPGIVRPQRVSTVIAKVTGRIIEGVRRRGKNILIDLKGGDGTADEVLHVHLRMTGNLFVIPDARLRPATARAAFELEDGRALIYEDSRALGKIHVGEQRVGKVGVEPLDATFTAELFDALARRSKQPAKLFLMDQKRVAGIGNIYAAEALYRAGVNPKTAISRVSAKKRATLHTSILEVLHEAVVAAEREYSSAGTIGEGDGFPTAVYGRENEPCLKCGKTIRRIAQGGRSTYFCPACQR